MSVKRPKVPTCHPDRRHIAKGLCGPCYQRMNVKIRKGYNRSRTKASVAADHLRLFFGLTVTTITVMFEAQHGNCKICNEPMLLFPERKDTAKAACVDHDHKCCSGKRTCGKCIRGLICQDCNRGLGAFHDDPIALLKAIEYLIGVKLT